MDGSKVEEETNLVKLPPELIQRVGIFCDVKSLGRLCMTCKELNFILSDEVVWKQQWHHICRRYNLVDCTLDPAKTTYKEACIRSTVCLFEGIFQNDVEAMTEGPGLGWSHVRNAMAFDCGSKMASIAWLFDYFRSSCPAITAHLKVKCCCEEAELAHPFVKQSKTCACKTLSLAELNQELKAQGHPALYRPVVVGQKAKHLSGQFPDLYEREEYPIYFTQPFCNTSRAQVGKRSGTRCRRAALGLEQPRPGGGQQVQGFATYGPSSGQQVQGFATFGSSVGQQVQVCQQSGPSGDQLPATSSHSTSVNSTSSGSLSSSSIPKMSADASHFKQSQFSADDLRDLPSCSTHEHSSDTADSVFDEQAHKPQVYFQVCNPVRDGDIVSLRDYELLLRHLHGSVTGGSQQLAHMRDICRTAFLLCEPARCSHETRVGLLKLMFEKLKVSRICLQNKAGLLPMDSSFNTCLIIESGATSTVVTPIINSRIQQDAVQFKPVGGLQVSLALADTITSKGIVNEVCVDSLDDRGVKEECWLAYQPLFEMRKKYATKNILVPKPRGKATFSSIPFGSERYLACEDMYCTLDLPNMVGDALQHCEPSSHRPLLSRVILTGGNGALKGFPQRLTRDLRERLPQYAEVIMVSRFDDVFTLLTLLGPGLDQKRWITRAEYVFEGVHVLDRYRWPEAYA